MTKRENLDKMDLIPTLKWVIRKLEEHERILKDIKDILRDEAQGTHINAIRALIFSFPDEAPEDEPNV